MKKTQLLCLWREIIKNKVSFLAVALIAAMTIAFNMCFTCASDAVKLDINRYFISNKLESMEILCANGITEDDIAAIQAHENVDIAEGGYVSTVWLDMKQEKQLVQLFSLGEQLNIPVVIDGELPKYTNEIAVEHKMAEEKGIAVGDSVRVLHNGELKEDTFKVTAIVNNPLYCNGLFTEARGFSEKGLGAADYYGIVGEMAFDKSYFNDCYTIARVRNNELDNCFYFSEEYRNAENAFADSLFTLGEERAALRHDSMLEQAQPAIDSGIVSADSISYKEWIFCKREAIGDLGILTDFLDISNDLSRSMTLIFLSVAIIVSHATISRMLDENRKIIGAQKSLGFTTGNIVRYYTAYGVLCAVTAVLFGIILTAVLQKIALDVYADQYLIGEIPMIFHWKDTVISALVCIMLFAGMSFFTALKTAGQPVVSLMHENIKDRKKHFFFEKWKCYMRLKLYTKVMIKNVLIEKRRMITTIIGVTGSVCLMSISFNLKMSIDDSNTRQFENYYFFENRLITDGAADSKEDFSAVLQDMSIDYLTVHDKASMLRTNDDRIGTCRIMAIEQSDNLEEFITFADMYTEEKLQLPENGILVSRKCAEEYKLQVGDTLFISATDGSEKAFSIAGLIEHYLPYHMIVTASDYYEEIMNEPADDCVFLLKGNIDGLHERVSAIDGYITIKDRSEYHISTEMVDMVIGIFIFLSLMVSLLVLLNQLVIHISRKSVELAVIRINGYTIKETKAYIYKDSIVLTFLGLLLGSVLSIALSYNIVTIMEGEVCRYVRTPYIQACLCSCFVAILFSVIVNIIALKRINKLNLTKMNSIG